MIYNVTAAGPFSLQIKNGIEGKTRRIVFLKILSNGIKFRWEENGKIKKKKKENVPVVYERLQLKAKYKIIKYCIFIMDTNLYGYIFRISELI